MAVRRGIAMRFLLRGNVEWAMGFCEESVGMSVAKFNGCCVTLCGLLGS